MIKVTFPSQFTKILQGQLVHSGEGENATSALASICLKVPELKRHLFLDSGELVPYIALSISPGTNIITSSSADSVLLKPGDSFEIIMPMAGG